MGDDVMMTAGLVALGDFNFPGQDDGQSVAHVADLKESIASIVSPMHTEPA